MNYEMRWGFKIANLVSATMEMPGIMLTEHPQNQGSEYQDDKPKDSSSWKIMSW